MNSSYLLKDFVVLSPNKVATKIPNSPHVFEKLEDQFGGFKGHELIACFEFESDWPSWEMHPHGDEIVVLLSGRATFLLDMDGQHQKINLSDTGEYVIVPKGVWHTAHIADRAKMLFITPGEGTQNKYI